MSKLVSKIYFEEIVEEKETLPKGLKFLEGVTFYAITEYIIAKKRQTRIEFLPSDLCNIINKAKRYESLSKIVDKTYKIEFEKQNKLIN